MLTTRGYKVISPGAWRQSARAEVVSYEAVGIGPTFFTYSVVVRCHQSWNTFLRCGSCVISAVAIENLISLGVQTIMRLKTEMMW